MIIPEGKQDKQGIDNSSKNQREFTREDESLPPSYQDVAFSQPEGQQRGGAASVPVPRPSQPPILKPTNFLYLSNNDRSIKGCYTINPFMTIPSSLLPPLAEGTSPNDRKNLDLQVKDGSIDVDIWLARPEESDLAGVPKNRATLYLKSKDGSVTARVRNVNTPVPFLLNVYAKDGSVTICLPQAFQGPMSLTTKNGSISLSNPLLEASTALAQIDSTRRYFVGDLSAIRDEEWNGDELKAESKDGSIKVKFVDEVTVRKPGLFSRMFGF
ncbi:hypothetical protein SERLA73DRAFT_174804 [Serpula lacrymans var. lacrymans S7.3]|uniref:DUF7330 domain-containing protein n=2 Tax=Serpula lacrymans var. lacrymans TaxID=341189 RepID=F8PKL4_SERL3|nr:uncharacterized protein SERLADRAFT_456469 [Serpula lacrymans var. lacrymans S7.9]EGO03348.1 hypothetical protein SERLA73DRAFT_174804 [Serpula lacrymans var. lacrymans S7.3]EGO29121.1 hypothetical protein SERLADRAFT_456469 [Serpula lacrymans var. lacrymans S7.9]